MTGQGENGANTFGESKMRRRQEYERYHLSGWVGCRDLHYFECAGTCLKGFHGHACQFIQYGEGSK